MATLHSIKNKIKRNTRDGMDPETSMYAAISDLEDRIKSKQKDVLVLARAIRFQDN